MKEVVAVVPATDRNRYSDRGDLASWGDSTLLEWKIAQLRTVPGISRIVVSATSHAVGRVAEAAGAMVKLRPSNLDLPGYIRHAVEGVGEDAWILWANPSSPFVGKRVFLRLLEEYGLIGAPEDGLVTARSVKEYMFHAGGAFGFDARCEARSRMELPEMKLLTNGACIRPAGAIAQRGNLFGASPAFLDVDWLETLEIREAQQMGLFEGLIAKYLEAES